MKRVVGIAAACLGSLLFSPANATVVTGTVAFYEMPETGNPDFGNGAFCCTAHYPNEAVIGALGTNQLPVYNPTYGGPAISDLINGQINWWQGTPTSTPGFSTDALGQYDKHLFTPDGTGSNNNTSFQTAIFTTNNLLANTTYKISYTADDDVFFATNGNLFSEDGGVHQAGILTTTALFNTGANGQLEIFFADRYNVESELSFTISAVPEPSTWAMMILGFFGVGFMAYRRKKNGPALRIA